MEEKNVNSGQKRSLINKSIQSIGEIGKIPPQAVDIEEAVLGAMLLERNAVNDAIDILEPESFYKMEHQKIYAAIKDLFGHSENIDILSVTEKLRKKGELQLVGGPGFIASLTNRVASAAHVEYHARIISEKYILRSLIEVSSEVIKNAYDETKDVFNVLNEAEDGLFKIAEGNLKKGYSGVKELVKEATDEIEAASKNKDGVSGVPTGFTDLDRLTSGWQKSDMIVLAARPGMGKTAFVLSMARNSAIEFGQATAIFSLEMSNVQLVKRMMAMETGISSEKLRKGFTDPEDWEKLHSRLSNLTDAPIFIDDTPALSIFELRAKCRRMKMQHDIQLVIIDYLQLMTAGTKGGNREQEISTISRSIKEIAKEINVPIIALSQLSRSVETRGGDKRPMLSDLRESGAIEQDADMVVFIYRPEYYGLDQDENGLPTEGIGEIIVAKHRNGSLDTVRLKFIKELTRFDNLDAFDTMDYGTSFVPNKDFDNSSDTITLGSKMNDDDIPLGNNLDDIPF
ncbi:replicative DNA helicase [Paracrocinitomix mangrovi]|uniref:replicative DNA helicase n=1 Tax=Paracrocinitomix mangrovi TaxID=2862509 RepID=UPI001C8DBAC3|nr:replicative DNA helicase [Paracrocinitomix mangrovi]UKN01734.1 replicative DNA helicase [Paracrocinitomix mangrovi]